jgi:hypothetical protein
MRCKPDELAIITRVPPTIPVAMHLLGRIVRVQCLTSAALPTWRVEEPIALHLFGWPAWLTAVEDEYLMPLRGEPTDEGTHVDNTIINPLELALGITARSYS